jgi:ParB family transcriptional regulator, chromosome partitioning protein
MELRTVDPRALRTNPANPRRTVASPEADAMLAASIAAIGIIQPPLVRADGDELVIVAGHRRVAAAIATDLSEIQVLVTVVADGSDDMRALSENIVRAALNPVDQWRAVEMLLAKDWTDAAIATALALPVRTVQKLHLLGRIYHKMLDTMAAGDMPREELLRTIASAPLEEQASVWKKHKPRKGSGVVWHEVARALSKRRMMAKEACFGDDLAKAYGIVWQEDLFAPADEDGRYTTEVEAFFGAQMEWLRENLPPRGVVLETDAYGRGQLPKGAERIWGTARKDDHSGWYLDPTSGRVESISYRISKPAAKGRGGDDETAEKPVAQRPRPPITKKGASLLGELRTQALHEALATAPIEGSTLMALLILGYAGTNVAIASGRATSPPGFTGAGEIARHVFVEGALTDDPAVLHKAARQMLIEILSCEQNRTNSGIAARLAGQAIGADNFLPNLATSDFLATLSRTVIEKAAADNGIAPKPRLRETRDGLIQKFAKEGRFFHPIASFAPDGDELQSFLTRARTPVPAALDGSDDSDEPPFDVDPDPEADELDDVEVAA